MPKGVEHVCAAAKVSTSGEVKKSVMPKGVEHPGLVGVTFWRRAGEEVRDADRR